MRIHIEPRTGKFDPGNAPRGPGRKTRLCTTRRTQGIFDDGEIFDTSDEWQFHNYDQEKLPLTGKTIFIVDTKYSKEYGTDQRRQRATAKNIPRVAA